MSFVWFLLSLIFVAAAIAVTVYKKKHAEYVETLREKAKARGQFTDEQIEAAVAKEEITFIPDWSTKVLSGLAVVFFGIMLVSQTVFYAEPGYIYHVRTILGQERVVTGTGPSVYLFGRYNKWKRAMTVQASTRGNTTNDGIEAEADRHGTSASLTPLKIMFLDQVDAQASATVRFSIPTDREKFLKLAHEYRSPENLLRTALIPAFKETLRATGSLMSAEEYYSGGQTSFNNEFENQMNDGVYLVKRKEEREKAASPTTASANATKGEKQDKFGDGNKTVFVVEKVYDSTGKPIRKHQKFEDFGIQVVDARVTDMNPNKSFVKRMQLKQTASADRAIARERRIQEEQERLLAIAKGNREVAQRQAKAKVEQIEKTTNAETEKQLALTEASKHLEQAKIDKQTAMVQLQRDQIKAKSVKVLADAEAYQKRKIIQADNALQQKLQTEVEIQKVWADAYAKRQVPQYVFGGGDSNVPVGSDVETSRFMKLMTIDAAKRLNYNRGLSKQSPADTKDTAEK